MTSLTERVRRISSTLKIEASVWREENLDKLTTASH
jgi:hypothetical protein